MMLERTFRKRIVQKNLDTIPGIYYFIKEARGLRGLPDIIGFLNGRAFVWELKRSEAEANKRTGRIVLQRLVLQKIKKTGCIARFVYPENFNECLEELRRAGIKH